jgi:hypothetical protein
VPSIEINLTEKDMAELTPENLLRACADQVLSRYVLDDEGELLKQSSKLRQDLEAIVSSEIRGAATAIAPDIARSILADKVVQTDNFGYARGEPKSVASIIAEQVASTLQPRSGRGGPGVLDKLIREEVDRQVKGELKDALDAAKKVVTDALADRVVPELRKALAAGIEF